MDEADKYKQRLEAIAEKRRLQEEQDRARREMEDEKLRLQQLKRKSLRDQWLMEGPPLSPNSPDAQSPRSPLWGSQAQEIEKRIDKLQSESQRLAEEEEKLKEGMEDGQTEAVNVAEAGAEIIHDTVVQNGANSATGPETGEEGVKTNLSQQLAETAAALTNGHMQADTNHNASELSNQSTTNGPVLASEGVISIELGPGLNLGVEVEIGQIPNVNINEEDEEGTVVMRAERVIITDEGEDVSEDLTPQEDRRETIQSEEITLPNPEAVQQEGETLEEIVKSEEAPEPTAEAEPATADGDVQGGITANENTDGETEDKGEDKQSEEPASVQVLFQSDALEGSTVALVPVYAEAQPPVSTPEPETEAAAPVSIEEAEVALNAQDPAPLSGQFQDVSLADPLEKRRTEAKPGEQEPLLSQAQAHNTLAPLAAAHSPASTETYSPARANQGEETEAPKHKTCQCCTVM